MSKDREPEAQEPVIDDEPKEFCGRCGREMEPFETGCGCEGEAAN